MEEDIKNSIESIYNIKAEFEVLKMEMALSKAKRLRITSFLTEEEQKNLNQSDLLQIYQGEWKKQTRMFCEVHHRPLSLYCFNENIAICEKCVVEGHINHSVSWIED